MVHGLHRVHSFFTGIHIAGDELVFTAHFSFARAAYGQTITVGRLFDFYL